MLPLLVRHASQLVQITTGDVCSLTGPNMASPLILSGNKTGYSLLVNSKGLIEAVGTDEYVMESLGSKSVAKTISAEGKSIIPGFVDGHTHPVWDGDRVHEFAMKLAGATYLQIHEKGGGIHFTVEKTREAPEEKLLALLMDRLKTMASYGTTTLEAKSGYGLDTENELKMLRVIEQSKKRQPLEISSTFCGAHAVPKGKTVSDAVDNVLDDQLPALVQGTADGSLSVENIDVFCEKGVFGTEDSEKILRAGMEAGLAVNFHGDELNYTGSAEMGASIGARAISHLERICSGHQGNGCSRHCSSASAHHCIPAQTPDPYNTKHGRGRSHGIPQLRYLIFQMGVSIGARAINHLEHASAAGIKAMAAAGTAAVLLPTTAFLLRLQPPPTGSMIAGTSHGISQLRYLIFQMGVSIGARAINHLEHASAAGIKAMAAAGTAAVLLPTTAFLLRLQPPPTGSMIAGTSHGISQLRYLIFQMGVSIGARAISHLEHASAAGIKAMAAAGTAAVLLPTTAFLLRLQPPPTGSMIAGTSHGISKLRYLIFQMGVSIGARAISHLEHASAAGIKAMAAAGTAAVLLPTTAFLLRLQPPPTGSMIAGTSHGISKLRYLIFQMGVSIGARAISHLEHASAAGIKAMAAAGTAAVLLPTTAFLLRLQPPPTGSMIAGTSHGISKLRYLIFQMGVSIGARAISHLEHASAAGIKAMAAAGTAAVLLPTTAFLLRLQPPPTGSMIAGTSHGISQLRYLIFQMGASIGARAISHLEHASAAGIKAMAAAGTAAVLLPTTAFLLRLQPPPTGSMIAGTSHGISKLRYLIFQMGVSIGARAISHLEHASAAGIKAMAAAGTAAVLLPTTAFLLRLQPPPTGSMIAGTSHGISKLRYLIFQMGVSIGARAISHLEHASAAGIKAMAAAGTAAVLLPTTAFLLRLQPPPTGSMIAGTSHGISQLRYLIFQMGASIGARAISHLEHASAAGIKAMAAAGTAAVLLPTTAFLLRLQPPPTGSMIAGTSHGISKLRYLIFQMGVSIGARAISHLEHASAAGIKAMAAAGTAAVLLPTTAFLLRLQPPPTGSMIAGTSHGISKLRYLIFQMGVSIGARAISHLEHASAAGIKAMAAAGTAAVLLPTTAFLLRLQPPPTGSMIAGTSHGISQLRYLIFQMGASIGARAISHLEHASAAGIKAMAAAGTAAVLLPTTAFLLRLQPPPTGSMIAGTSHGISKLRYLIFQMGVSIGARAISHLEHASAAGIKAMAAAGTAAVLLPTTAFLLRLQPPPTGSMIAGTSHGISKLRYLIFQMGVSIGARAISHLEHASAAGIKAMAAAGTAAVLLPTTAFLLRLQPPPTGSMIAGTSHGISQLRYLIFQMGASIGARAISHLEHASAAGIKAMAAAGTAAVLLPTTAFLLRLQPPPTGSMIAGTSHGISKLRYLIFQMGVSIGARAISHLEHASAAGIKAMAAAGTAAVLLPTTAFLLRLQPPPTGSMIAGTSHGISKLRYLIFQMGVSIGARAISHLEHASAAGIKAMAAAGTAAVLLPTTAFLLRLQPPPARSMIEEGVVVALGTDFNPNAYCMSMPHVMNLACILFKMTMEEALVASTINAAASIGRGRTHGALSPGRVADFVILNTDKDRRGYGWTEHCTLYTMLGSG